MVDSIIYAAIGFVAGAITGGAIVGNIIAKDFSRRIDMIDKQNRNLTDELVRLRDENIDKLEKRIKKKEDEMKEKEKGQYENLIKKYIPDDDDDSEESDVFVAHFPSGETVVERIEIEDRSDEIKRIDEGRWTEELNYRDNQPLTYFQEDGTLTDDNKNMIHNPSQVVGSEIMDIIDETENDYLYALDEKLDKMYEITIEHDMSYTRDILGAY